MDSSNLFFVRRTKAGVQVGNWNGEPLSDEEALNLAGWLLGIADPESVETLASAWENAGEGEIELCAFERVLREMTREPGPHKCGTPTIKGHGAQVPWRSVCD